MAGKIFARLNTSLLNSRRYRSLSNPIERVVYFTAHLSIHSNYAGIYRCPLVYFSDEARQTRDEVVAALQQLETAGLLEYDWDHEYLRIAKWFYKANCPDNLSQVRSLARDFLSDQFPLTDMLRKSVAEFVVGALKRTKSFKNGSSHGAEIQEELRLFLVKAELEMGGLRPFLENEVASVGNALIREFEHVTFGLLEAETLAQRHSADAPGNRDPALTVIAGCRQGASTEAAHETIRDSNEKKQIHETTQTAVSGAMPLKQTLDSEIVRALRTRSH